MMRTFGPVRRWASVIALTTPDAGLDVWALDGDVFVGMRNKLWRPGRDAVAVPDGFRPRPWAIAVDGDGWLFSQGRAIRCGSHRTKATST